MNNRYPKFNPEAALLEARNRFPLERVIEQYGHGPRNQKWKQFDCPFCRKKNKAGTFKAQDGTPLFKCHSTRCPSGAEAVDAIGYIVLVTGRGRADAFVDYLKMAGVWREVERYQTPPKPPAETPPPAENSTDTPSTPPLEQEPAPNQTDPPPESSNPAVASNAAPGEGTSEAAPEANGSEAIDRFFGETPAAPAATVTKKPAIQIVVDEPTEEFCRTAMQDFYDQLTITTEDLWTLYHKRGLARSVSERLGFRSSTESNKQILLAMKATHPMPVLLESGLWAKRDGVASPNAQFYGWGRIGKAADDWGWANPILIPYFDNAGALFHLRPHKGGIKDKGSHVYVPRARGEEAPEKFSTVVITEGEFKAAALYDCLPAEWGCVALPGVQMANSYAVYEELEEWLRQVRARVVKVIYDNEDKGTPGTPGYKEDKTKRYDAPIWAYVLATKIWKRLKIRTELGMLPADSRVNGKSDWDGALRAFNEEANPADVNRVCPSESQPA